MKLKQFTKEQEAERMRAIANVPVSDVSIEELIDNGLLALHREIKNILMQSANGKLDAATARDLRDHLKLLFELKDREVDYLKGLSEDELNMIVEQRKKSGQVLPE